MRKLIAAALALTLLGAGAAEAKNGNGNGNGKGNGRGRDIFEQGGRGDRDWQAKPGRGQGRRQQDRAWSRGERLPDAYQGQGVDYRSEHLRRPPAGYRWVRVGNDYVLMATTTGLILEVIKGF